MNATSPPACAEYAVALIMHKAGNFSGTLNVFTHVELSRKHADLNRKKYPVVTESSNVDVALSLTLMDLPDAAQIDRVFK